MSNFLSQLEINPQNGQTDDEEFQEEDFEREKEIKELLENELDEDDFFEDDNSFASHHTSSNSSMDPSIGYNQLPTYPKEPGRQEMPAPLLTSRGSDFIKKISPSIEREEKREKSSNPTHFQSHLNNNNNVGSSFDKDSYTVLGYEQPDFPVNGKDTNGFNSHEALPFGDGGYRHSFDQGDHFEHRDDYEDVETLSNEEGFSSRPMLPSSPMHDSFMRHFDNTKYLHSDDLRVQDEQLHAPRSLTPTQDFHYNISSDTEARESLSKWESSFDMQKKEAIRDSDAHFNDKPQLRILYEARGKKIEHLQKEIEASSSQQAKEIRILQHKLSMAIGERDGMSLTLQHSQDSLQDMKSTVNDLQKRLAEESEKRSHLRNEYNELFRKNEISESTIEGLNQQIAALSRVDSLSKLRSQHEVLMATSRQKHEEEILLLKEKLDDTRKELNWKTEDVNRLQDEVQSAKKHMTTLKVESADAVNKLTASLKQSQQQLAEMLAQGSENSIADVKLLLIEANKERLKLVEENNALKDEVKDAKEQLGLYEVALNSTIEGPSSSTPYNPHDVAKKLSQLDAFKTPLSRFAKDKRPMETNSHPIREDLIKALANNKTKRDELNSARLQISSLKEQLEALSADKKRIEVENEALKAENDAHSIKRNETSQTVPDRQLENVENLSDLQQKLKSAESEVQGLEKQLQFSQNEVTALRNEMGQLIRQFDKDKIEALRSCEKTYNKFNEDSKQHLENSLNSLHAKEVAELKEEIKRLAGELLDVKDSYVSLANENKVISDQVRTECEAESALHLKELKDKLSQEYKEELRKTEEKVLGKSYTHMEELRKKLRDEFEEETKHRIETSVALAKVEWFARYEEEKSKAIERAIEATKLRLGKEQDLEKESFKEALRSEMEKEMQEEHIKRLDSTLSKAREEWEAVTRVETEKAVQEALEQFKQECQEQRQNELEKATNWAEERDSLQQQILKEESMRIRTELLRGFAEDLSEVPVGDETSQLQVQQSKDVYSDLKESIAFVRSFYKKKFDEQKAQFEEQMKRLEDSWHLEQNRLIEETITQCRQEIEQKANSEKEAALNKLNQNWEARLADVKAREKDDSIRRNERELERAKSEWRIELDELQREHEHVLKTTIGEVRSKASLERANIEKGYKEVVRRLKNENTEKLDRQRLELESYHSALTKKTLKLAKKEWELEYSFAEQPAQRRGGRRVLSESTQNRANMDHSGNSDSGFTSPQSRVLSHAKTPTVQNSTEIGHKEGARSSKVVSVAQSSPPYEMFLSEIKADIVRGGSEDIPALKHVFTQTDLPGQDNASALQEMRQYYLETVRKIKEDVSAHISRTKENASTRIRNEVAREKKQLVNQIRKKYLKSLKADDTKGRRDVAVLEILKEAGAEGCGLAQGKEEGKEDQLKGRTGISPTREPRQPSSVVSEKRIKEMDAVTRQKIGTQLVPRHVSVRGNKKDSSPNTSMFSCESNGTFYTELPSTSIATPSSEKVFR